MIPNGAALGRPIVPYPCPAFPALEITITPGYFESSDCGVDSVSTINDRMSNPGGVFSDGKLEIPQLFDIMSALGLPENIQVLFLLSKPEAHSHPYTVSPSQSAFTGMIFAFGATPGKTNFLVLL